ncbi:MAG: murein biosynthesis integral rane protein MurJ [Bacillales bacterium]|nr:murein biosynthesis integral rane protein MurJ [Bacillales bacterium]
MKKTVFLMMIITGISGVLAFAREMELAYFFGASHITDSFLIAQTIPVTVLGFIATGIAVTFIPMYHKIEAESGIEEADKYTSNLLNILMLITTVLFILGFIFATPLTKLFALGFTGEELKLASNFTRVCLVSMFFTLFITIMIDYLQIKGSFIITSMISIPFSFIIIAFTYIASKWNLYILTIGFVFAVAFQAFFMLFFAKRKGYKHKIIINIKDHRISEMLKIAIPAYIGNSIGIINSIIEKSVASSILVGGISALNYSSKLSGFFYTILSTSLLTYIYPSMSKNMVEGNIEKVKRSIVSTMSTTIYFIVPVSAVLITFATQVVTFVFARGAFNEADVSITASILHFSALGMVGLTIREVLTKPFYAMNDTKTPMINSFIGIVINIILILTFSSFLGIKGIALASCISSLIIGFLLYISLRKKIGPIGIIAIAKSFIKIVFSAIIVCFAARYALQESMIHQLNIYFSIITISLLAAVSYIGLTFVLGVEIGKAIIEILKSRVISKFSVSK